MSTSEFNGRSILRGLEILQVVNRLGKASSTDIAQVTTIPYPTVCRISNFLAELGMLKYVKDGRYFQPTAMVQSLSGAYREQNPIVTASGLVLARLSKKFGLPITLETRVGISMILRDISRLHQKNEFESLFPGYTMPMLNCASGRICFSFCRDEEREEIIGLFERFDAHNQAFKAMRETQQDFLDLHRKQGFAIYMEPDIDKSHTCLPPLSVPIVIDGTCLATVSLAFSGHNMSAKDIQDAFVPDLLDAAGDIEQLAASSTNAMARHG